MSQAIDHRSSSPERLAADSAGDFWRSVVETSWEQRCWLFPTAEAQHLPRVEPHELFAATAACVEDFLRTGRQRVRFYIENGSEIDLREGDQRHLLPVPQDGSFEGYHERMVRHGFNEYGLIIADWHQFDRDVWQRILVSLDGLFDLIGVSRSRMDTQVFIGNYRVTPFGVHLDAASGFHFPVIGHKVMRFWEPSVADHAPGLARALDYQVHLRGSTVLDARAGEVMYWPSDHWHVGESDGSFSVTWGTGYWLGDGVGGLPFEEAAKVAAGEALRPSPRLAPAAAISAAESRGAVDDLLAEVLRLMASEEMRERVIRAWLLHYSAAGFLRVPPLSGSSGIRPGATVRRNPAHRIFVSQIRPDAMCVAAAGHVSIFPAHRSIQALANTLNDDRPVLFGGLGETNADEALIASFLDFCARAGALSSVCP